MRPLAAGQVTQFQALTFLGGQLAAGLAVLTQLNLYSYVPLFDPAFALASRVTWNMDSHRVGSHWELARWDWWCSTL